MSRNVFAIIDDLVSGLQELKGALAPLSSMAGKSPVVATATAPRRKRARRSRRAAGASRAARPKAAAVQAPAAKAKSAPKAQRPVSAQVRARRVMQGKYMGAIRGLSATQLAQVKKVRVEQGYEKALSLAGSFNRSK